MSTSFSEQQVVAVMDTSRPMGGNRLHSDDGAREMGFQSALVVGGYVYGWTVPAILEVMGDEWPTRGWASIRFRRPTYVGDQLTVRVRSHDGRPAELSVENQRGEVCVSGELGMGEAPWLADVVLPSTTSPQPRPEERPPLTLENAPVGQDLRPSGSRVREDASLDYVRGTPDEANPRWRDQVHPGWLVGRMTGLLLHSYTFSPSIAASIKVQYLAPFSPGQDIVVAGHLHGAYDRNGHHYALVDGLLIGEDGQHLARVQQETIFRVAKREQA